ncbi:MAG: hypothetical protein QXI12_07555 [Candidatus Methanomethyliaceae archaeon]
MSVPVLYSRKDVHGVAEKAVELEGHHLKPMGGGISPQALLLGLEAYPVSRLFSGAHAQVERGSVLSVRSLLFFPHIDRFCRLLPFMPTRGRGVHKGPCVWGAPIEALLAILKVSIKQF